MKRIAIAVFAALIAVVVGGQTLTPSGGLTGGTTSTAGCAAGLILLSDGTKLQCGPGVMNTGALGSTTATYSNSTSTTTGVGFFGSGASISIINSGTARGFFSSNGYFDLPNATFIGLESGATGTPDVGISRLFPSIIGIGNGTSASTVGGYITGTASLTSLTTGTNADFLCLAANGTVLLQTSACTISSLRFKPDWKPYRGDAMAKVAKFDVGTFHIQTGDTRDPNAQNLQAGLSAESVAAIAPECAIYEDDMKTPKSYRQECVIALLVRAIQQLKK